MHFVEKITYSLFKIQDGIINNPILNKLDGAQSEVKKAPLTPLIARLWRTIIMLGGLLLIVYLIWGAFEWITSSSEPEKLKHARYKIVNAVIGLLILTATFAIVTLLKDLVGFDVLEIAWPTPPGA